MLRFLSERRGTTAVAFGLTLLPVMGLVGAAVDSARVGTTRELLQAQTDMIALRGIDTNRAEAYASLSEATLRDMLGPRVDDVRVTVRHVAGPREKNDFEVVVRASVPVPMLSAVPGVPGTVEVVTVAVSRGERRLHTPPPAFVQLSHEAADYNQLYAYCFTPAKPGLGSGVGAAGVRGPMTLIADNGGTKYDFVMPVCNEGETFSLRLRNVRNARTNPARWNDPRAEQYDYYSDTTESNGNALKLNFPKNSDIVETVLCDTLAQCDPTSRESIIPSGRHRNPHAATRACTAGKFMYYGFEDRPNGDRDFDDIRIVVGCSVRESDPTLVLVR